MFHMSATPNTIKMAKDFLAVQDASEDEAVAEMWQALLDAAHTVLGNVLDSDSQGPDKRDLTLDDGTYYDECNNEVDVDEDGTPWYADYFALRQATHAIDDANLTAVPSVGGTAAAGGGGASGDLPTWTDGDNCGVGAPPQKPAGGTITIEISGGVLTDVQGLPDGWTYELIDHDNEVRCQRCGSELYDVDGHCRDETCPYSDRKQDETFIEG